MPARIYSRYDPDREDVIFYLSYCNLDPQPYSPYGYKHDPVAITVSANYKIDLLYALLRELGDLPPSAVREVLRELHAPGEELRRVAKEFLELSGFKFDEHLGAIRVIYPGGGTAGFWPTDTEWAVKLAIKWLRRYYPYSINRQSRELMASWLEAKLIEHKAILLAHKIRTTSSTP